MDGPRIRTTSFGSKARRSWRRISSTRSSRFTGCRALPSTTSTSRSSFVRCCGACASRTSATRISSSTSRWRSTSSSARTSASSSAAAGLPWPSLFCSASRRRAVDRVVHQRELLPGDHQGAHRGSGFRQGRLPPRPEGKRDHGAPHPGGHRTVGVQAAQDGRRRRRRALCPSPVACPRCECRRSISS
jgi:hypothetical protein